MAQAIMSVRMQESDKKNFDIFCESVGMTPSTAVNLFIKAVLREQKIPFKIKQDPFYNSYNQEILRKSIAQLEAGKVQQHDLIEVE